MFFFNLSVLLEEVIAEGQMLHLIELGHSIDPLEFFACDKLRHFEYFIS